MTVLQVDHPGFHAEEGDNIAGDQDDNTDNGTADDDGDSSDSRDRASGDLDDSSDLSDDGGEMMIRVTMETMAIVVEMMEKIRDREHGEDGAAANNNPNLKMGRYLIDITQVRTILQPKGY